MTCIKYPGSVSLQRGISHEVFPLPARDIYAGPEGQPDIYCWLRGPAKD